MNRLKIFYLIFILLPGMVAAQSFEGVVTYTIDVETSPQAAQMGITKAALINKMKEQNLWSDTETVTYKGGLYRTELLSPKRTWTIYRSDSNKIYHLQDSLNECMVISVSGVGKGHVKQVDTTIKILGHQCKLVSISWGDTLIEYAYSPDGAWRLSPQLYKNDVFDGWYEYLNVAGTVPLQIKRVMNDIGTIIYTAVRIDKKQIDSKVFALPRMHTDTTRLDPATNVYYMKIDK